MLEKFMYKGKQVAGAQVRIDKFGRLVMNRECYEAYFKGYKFASLYYDAVENKIGIKPEKERLAEHFTLHLNKQKISASVSAVTFFRTYGIPHAVSRSLPAEWSEELQMILINLNE